MDLSKFESGDIFVFPAGRTKVSYHMLVGKCGNYQLAEIGIRGELLGVSDLDDWDLDKTESVWRYVGAHLDKEAILKFLDVVDTGHPTDWKLLHKYHEFPELSTGNLIKLKQGKEFLYGFVVYAGTLEDNPEIFWIVTPEKDSNGEVLDLSSTDNIDSIKENIEYIAATTNAEEVWETVTGRDDSKIIWRCDA